MSRRNMRESGYMRWILVLAVIVLAVIAATFHYRNLSAENSFLADTIEVTWTNESMEPVDLTDQVRKEKIVDLLHEHGADSELPEEEENQPHKGDLDITVKDKKGETHYFHLSHEGGEYRYYTGEKEYTISDGEELYQEVASEL